MHLFALPLADFYFFKLLCVKPVDFKNGLSGFWQTSPAGGAAGHHEGPAETSIQQIRRMLRKSIQDSHWKVSHLPLGPLTLHYKTRSSGESTHTDWPLADWPHADWPLTDWPRADWPHADWPHTHCPPLHHNGKVNIKCSVSGTPSQAFWVQKWQNNKKL